MNRFTPDDLIAKGYVYTRIGWVKGLAPQIAKIASIPPPMPKATPQPSKRRKTARTLTDDQIYTQAALCSTLGSPEPEYRFHPTRKWRFDWAWAEFKIAIEVQGGIWTNGRHTRGAALLKEWEKLNMAAEMGWRIFYVQPDDLHKMSFRDQIARSVL